MPGGPSALSATTEQQDGSAEVRAERRGGHSGVAPGARWSARVRACLPVELFAAAARCSLRFLHRDPLCRRGLDSAHRSAPLAAASSIAHPRRCAPPLSTRRHTHTRKLASTLRASAPIAPHRVSFSSLSLSSPLPRPNVSIRPGTRRQRQLWHGEPAHADGGTDAGNGKLGQNTTRSAAAAKTTHSIELPRYREDPAGGSLARHWFVDCACFVWQIADARTYAGVDKGVMGGGVGGPSGASLASAMRPSAAGVDGSAFMHAYNQGPQHGPMASMPLHVQQQQHAAQQRAMAQMASARMMQPGPQQSRPLPSGPDFADQFMAMELQHKQQKEFEQIFAGGGGPQQQHGPDAWAMDFAAKEAQHRQQHMMQSQQHAMMRAQAAQHQHTSHWGRTGMAGGMMMGGGYASQMMGGGMYSQMQHHPMHMGPSSIAAQQRSSSVQIQEVPDSTAAGPQQAAPATAQADDEAEDNLYAEAATDNEFEEAYRNATGYGSQADWGSQYNAESQAAPAQESNMGGGMSKQMIDDLMNSDNPKWRNSKFLAFIDKISKGEIEFKDNQAIDKGPQPQRAAGSEEWAGEYAQNAAQLGAEWADQFSTQKHHPASWGDSASSSSVSASAQAAMAEGQNADASWLEDYAASGEADTEFRDFDWAAALAKAKESIPERKDPAYAFTDASANPSMGTDPALAFDRGVQLFREGKLKEAILAFESVVQAVPDHADAWSYLGEAQAHNEEENNAIAAFLKCVSIDPYNLKALLQLGVSYTNDLEESRALNYLKTWLQNNPDYQSAALTQAKQQADEFEQMYGSNKNNGMYSCKCSSHA